MSTTTQLHPIRPSARLLNTIGADLVKDQFSAIVELVKNSYDADATSVTVSIAYDQTKKELNVAIIDNGHGMSYETITDKWLVPATADKLERRYSASGRLLQGRKGIGRFAAGTLGSLIRLSTSVDGERKVALELNLEQLSNSVFLDEIRVSVSQTNTNTTVGTTIEVVSTNVDADQVDLSWGAAKRHSLTVELRKLLSPVSKDETWEAQDAIPFNIHLSYLGIPSIQDGSQEIKPFHLVDLYDYRISGIISQNGEANLKYINSATPALGNENIEFNVSLPHPLLHCLPGPLRIDLRVFDRDSDSIDLLINRGLSDPDTGEKVGKRKAREILDTYYGISIFRGGFRVRPYGDQDFDWLNLDKDRVQNPSVRIGHNQIIGTIGIESEEVSNLQEKSARDGLVEGPHYQSLKHILKLILNELEVRRRVYRERTSKGRKRQSIEKDIDDLFDLNSFGDRLEKRLFAIPEFATTSSKASAAIREEIQKVRNEKAEELQHIRDTIALYQGQATLGKITHLVLHEGRKYVKAITEFSPRIVKLAIQLSKVQDEALLERLSDRSNRLVDSAKSLSYLFKRIEPLAVARRPTAKSLLITNELSAVADIYYSEAKDSGIEIKLQSETNATVIGTSFDFVQAFSNLFENSIYWLKVTQTKDPVIQIEAVERSGFIQILFCDNGPGFQGTNLDLMFEPGYTTRPDGLGLGLALSGEAILRINGTIKAVAPTSNGACFQISIKSEEK